VRREFEWVRPMKHNSRFGKLTIDDSPPSAARKKVEAELVAFRSLSDDVKRKGKERVAHAIAEILRKEGLNSTGTAK
jgi:hypothetical protein